VINHFATDPPPQEPASPLLPFCLTWVHANGDRHLCNTYSRRDCEAQGTSYWYVFITSEQSGIPFRLRLTLLCCQRPSCSLLSFCANASDQSDGYSPSGFKGTDPDRETRGRTTARRGGRAPPSATECLPFILFLGAATCATLCPSCFCFISAQTRSSRRSFSSYWVC
jgi:hypothetical protein